MVEQFDDKVTAADEFRYRGGAGSERLPEFADAPDGHMFTKRSRSSLILRGRPGRGRLQSASMPPWLKHKIHSRTMRSLRPKSAATCALEKPINSARIAAMRQ